MTTDVSTSNDDPLHKEVPHLTRAQSEKLRKELVEKVGVEVATPVSDNETLERFFRACGGKESQLPAVLKRLVATAKWHHEAQPCSVDCEACHTSSGTAHYMHVVGHDDQGRPVIYSNFSLIGTRASKPLLDHMIQMFEMAIKLMPPGVTTWVWLNDFHGFGFMDMNPTLALNFIHLLANHYPERLGQLCVLDAPGMCTPLWNMVKPFIDPVTHAKIKFLPYDLPEAYDEGITEKSKLAAALHEISAGKALIEWVAKEMSCVRAFSKKKGPRPVYNLDELRKCAREGTLPPPSPAAPPAAGSEGAAPAGNHSHYGTASLMKSLMKDSQALFSKPKRDSPATAREDSFASCENK